jgi:hypothetical protein
MGPEVLWRAASTDGPTTSIEGVFLSYGLIGVVALVLGYFAISTIKDLRERAARLEDDNRRLYTMMADQFVPALTKSVDALETATTIMSEIRKRDEINAAVEAAKKRAGQQ